MGLGAPPQIVLESSIVHVATWREVVAAVWHAPGTAAEVRGVYAAQRAFAQRLGPDERMIVVSAIDARVAVTLDPDVRRAVEEGTRAQRERVKASVVLMATTGFAAAMIRSVVAALLLVNRPEYPMQVFNGTEAASRWAATFLTRSPSSPVSEADLGDALRAMISPTR
jgi:hypothetical protein